VRLRRPVALALVALSLVPFGIAALILAGQYGYGPLDFGWALLLAVAGAHIGPISWLFWSLAAGCAIAAVVLAWRTPRPPPHERVEPQITVRGPVGYAGPGSLGGTESAMRHALRGARRVLSACRPLFSAARRNVVPAGRIGVGQPARAPKRVAHGSR